ncbi:MAG: phosphoribosylformylglycinamidine synthase subunit PurL [Candidatus Eisenbacteria bacterium]
MNESSVSDVKAISIKGSLDDKVRTELDSYGLRLTAEEARHLVRLLGRDPTLVEATIFDIMWSEHCSYKSSRHLLKKYLPVSASNVVLGPGEDAGIIRLCSYGDEDFCLVVAHESHNHPSQVLPFEGAATGIGGIVRDVYCMGADVVAVMDALRFGDPYGPNKNRVREVAAGVVSGIWQYGNALGVANMGGDVCFDPSYDENCLVNVIAVGVVKEREIVRSAVPKEAQSQKYDLILVGKPTDASGFGGAAFASDVLDSGEWGESRSAVQVPDPFLKRILAEANKAVLRLVHEKGLKIGFKDLGAGGIACATSELAAASGFGARIELSSVPLDTVSLPPEVILCSETQERFALAVPSTVTEEVLHIYNDEFELPFIYHRARATVIGAITTDGRYVVRSDGLEVCSVDAETITSGISTKRGSRPPESSEEEPEFSPPEDLGRFLVQLLGSPNGASRSPIFSYYDCEVGGRGVIRPGDADAGVFAPIPGCTAGVAVAVDGNPAYGLVSPYWGGAHAVAEAMRNVACVGATPRALSDCMNFGSPEIPGVFYQFEEALRGVGECAAGLWQKGTTREPVPIVTGNVSFYNESSSGKAVAPSPIVACYGTMDDYSEAVTMGLKKPGSLLFMLGERRNELGGSLYYQKLLGRLGKNVPEFRFEEERARQHLVIEAIELGLVESCHDVSSGGLLVTLAEMCMASPATLGVDVDAGSVAGPLRLDKALFSESPGFILELTEAKARDFVGLARERGVRPIPIGRVTEQSVLCVRGGVSRRDRGAADDAAYSIGSEGVSGSDRCSDDSRAVILRLPVEQMKAAWEAGLVRAMA